jgi:drug/metabolite transporter (DMT)-like permease
LAVFNLTPVLALMVMALWQKVPMGWPVWVGAVLIITGIMLARMGRLAIVKKSTMS